MKCTQSRRSYSLLMGSMLIGGGGGGGVMVILFPDPVVACTSKSRP